MTVESEAASADTSSSNKVNGTNGSHNTEAIGKGEVPGSTPRDVQNPQLPLEAEEQLQKIIKRYPQKKSAVMPALYLAQEHFGYVNDMAIRWVSHRLELPPVHVIEVATFYTMYYKKPVGKFHVQVCRTLSCALRGAQKLTEHLHKRLGILPHEVSDDGLWSYEEVECLGSCGSAPMCEINDRYFENLDEEKLEEILTSIEAQHPPLRFSTSQDSLGTGLQEYSPSQVWCDDKGDTSK